MHTKRLLISLLSGLGVTLFVLGWLAAGPVHAATIIVTNTNDSGSGSLRQAIADAANGDTINFSLTYPATTVTTSHPPTVQASMRPSRFTLTASRSLQAAPATHWMSFTGMDSTGAAHWHWILLTSQVAVTALPIPSLSG